MKAMKKVLAFVLALAMVVTAVPVTNAAAKTANLSAGKTVAKTYYAGKTHTLKLKGVTKADVKSTTWTSSKPAVVKIVADSQTKVSAQYKCVKKGTATVTAKVTLKNGKTKTYKAKITVKAPKVTVSPSQANVEVGKTVALTVTQAPAPTNAKVTFTTSDASVATVDSKGVITGVKAGTATITATLTCGTKKKTASVAVTVTEEEKKAPEMTSLTAVAVNKLVAVFDAPVDSSAKVKVTKAGQTADVAGTAAWNEARTELSFTTTANMLKGTYTVTVTVGEGTMSKDVVIEDRKVAKIEILNKIALTGAKGADKQKQAFAYYDVLDQYGNSMRASTTISWNSSCKVVSKDTATGKLTLERTDGSAFTYGEQIFLTGVYAKTGVMVNETLSVGQEQALDTVELVGFVKKGTSKLIKKEDGLPEDFKSNAYFLLYNVKDQNGNDLVADKYIDKSEVTFISDNVLVVKELAQDVNPVTIDGKEYSAALVTPGIKVADGGDVTITAIANKTGKQSRLNIHVGKDAVLTSFTMQNPGIIIADGDQGINIPFTALDQNGNKMTNFAQMAKQGTFNTLSFSVSDGAIELAENNDGSASLKFSDKNMPWSDAQTTDGVDRPVNITSIVVNGNSDSLLLSIQDKRRPVGIKESNLDKVQVENTTLNLYLVSPPWSPTGTNKSFQYIDQYNAQIGASWEWGSDNGFFEAANNGTLKGTDFLGYDYGVQITYSGNGYLKESDTALTSGQKLYLTYNVGKTFTSNTNVKATQSGENFKYEIVRKKLGEDWETVSPAKSETFTIIDITQVKNIAISDIPKLYVSTNYSHDEVFGGAKADMDKSVQWNEVAAGVLSGLNQGGENYQKTVEVKGTYNGASVTVPAVYYTTSGDKITNATSALGQNTLNSVNVTTGSGLKWSDLYGKTSANYARKDAKGTITVKIYELYSNATATLGDRVTTDADIEGGTAKPFDTAIKAITISDANPVATKIETSTSNCTVNANSTSLSVINAAGNILENIGGGDTMERNRTYNGWYKVVDQYGVNMSDAIACKVSEIKEGDNNYAENSITVTGNDSNVVSIYGLERSDTFTLTIYVAGDPNVSTTVKVTVGADKKAKIDANGNSYRDVLINNDLEPLRLAGLN